MDRHVFFDEFSRVSQAVQTQMLDFKPDLKRFVNPVTLSAGHLLRRILCWFTGHPWTIHYLSKENLLEVCEHCRRTRVSHVEEPGE
jgi:hypothetical protein